MSHYHVLLPPTILAPLHCGTGETMPRLEFEKLLVPRNIDSQFEFDSTPAFLHLGPSQSQNQDPSQAGPSLSFSGVRTSTALDQSRKRRPPTASTTADDSIRHADHSISVEGKSRGTSIKRSRGPLRASNSVNEDSMGSEVSGSGSGTGRRRSARLDKSASGLLGTFPNVGIDTTTISTHDMTGNAHESYMSLNTTISNPSQYPPTADQSSLLNLPRWSIPLAKLTPLPTLLARPRSNANRNGEMVNTIVCVLSVDQPVLRKRKEEKARGREGTLWIGNWSVTAPPPAGSEGEVGSCMIKLWDKVAQEWGDERVRKGDVVLLENVSFKPASNPRLGQTDDSPQITISDHPKPKITILYRTLPRYYSPSNDYVHVSAPALNVQDQEGGGKVLPEDKVFRPDLRLSRSDLGVRKVGEIVRWFAEFVGGHVPS